MAKQANNKTSRNQDLSDNQHDEDRMQPESVTFDLPDVKDIPGQENIVVPPLGELADTTISSDDEEGVGLFDDDDEEEDADIMMGTEADISPGEISMLEQTDSDMPTDDDMRLKAAGLDQVDFEGEAINEGSMTTNVSGSDLDDAGTDSDDPMESIGEEDEENNLYSLGGAENDNVTEGTP
jgi:hypothetical protein